MSATTSPMNHGSVTSGHSATAAGSESLPTRGAADFNRAADPKPLAETGHSYDGITEYDNPTPGWWHLLFFLSIIFSIGYFIIYSADPLAPTVQGDWEKDVAEANAKIFAKIGNLKADEPTMLAMMVQPEWMSFGTSLFKANCISCHGREGQGEVGPNLTDDSYKNITQLPDFLRVVREGAAGGAMPAWKGRLSDNEVVLVASYAASLRGKNLPGPRGAEGAVAPPWPPLPAAKQAAVSPASTPSAASIPAAAK